MRWQNPWAWFGLLTLVLPVLVHLFSRRQTRIEPFPTLRFIDVSRLLPTRRTQLTDVLLLLVRLLIFVAAVAALAQPLFRDRASSGAVSTAVVVDTTVSGVDRTQVDRALGESIAPSSSQLRVNTSDPAVALAGAAGWLETQTGAKQLVIASDFRGGTIDSLDLAMLPRDVTVRLVVIGNAAASTATSNTSVSEANASSTANQSDAVYLASSGVVAANVRSAVIGAVRTVGASTLVESLPLNAQHVIVIAPSDADSLATWLRDARSLSQRWMGDVMLRLRRDTTLVSASADAAVGDTAVATPFTVLARNSSNAPVVAIAALPSASADSSASARLLVWTRTTTDALTTASVLLGASRALAPDASAASGGAVPDSAQLRRWEKAPAAEPVPAFSRSTDALTGASDARSLWVAALLLLGVEAVLRSRSRRNSTLAMSDAAASGSSNG